MCKVCTRLAKTLRKWDRDGQIEVVASQTPRRHGAFSWIPARAYAEALQLIGPGGRTWQGAAAIEQLLNILPKGSSSPGFSSAVRARRRRSRLPMVRAQPIPARMRRALSVAAVGRGVPRQLSAERRRPLVDDMQLGVTQLFL